MAETVGQTEMEALRRQDSAAFGRLVERHQTLVLGLAQSMGLRGPDLDDAAAEAFAAVYKALPRFQGKSELATWIYRIAARSILKVRVRRDKGRRNEALPELPHQPEPDALEADELRQQVWRAVEQLDPRLAMAVEMMYRRDWPIEKIAEALACPPGTVKTLLFRAREKLRHVFVRAEIGQ